MGDGNTIDIRRDHWSFEGLNGDSVQRDKLHVNERKVRDLWDPNLIWKHVGGSNMNIPIPHTGIKDGRIWFHNTHGVYTSKSAYSWSLLKRIGFGPHRIFWKIIWKLNMLPKIKVFSWRLGHDHLPAYDNIARIRQNFSNTCPRCKNSAETIIHVMKDCPVSREILTLGGLNNRLTEGIYDRCIDWLEDVLRLSQTVVWGMVLLSETQMVLLLGVAMLDTNWAEMEAFVESMQLATTLNAPNIIFESDNANLVNKVNKRNEDLTILSRYAKEREFLGRVFERVAFSPNSFVQFFILPNPILLNPFDADSPLIGVKFDGFEVVTSHILHDPRAKISLNATTVCFPGSSIPSVGILDTARIPFGPGCKSGWEMLPGGVPFLIFLFLSDLRSSRKLYHGRAF
ncbi:zf-RVT domain-containing protein [Gossypium australe]|uniref:Zf-RVT domain-containing protein n=1 Tax=Gossypium australe TaxID=47621 RepID=A0A5B6WZ93_9ROSI|nr:zf-RVT domain-containing protein [Gossypium australe]